MRECSFGVRWLDTALDQSRESDLTASTLRRLDRRERAVY